MPQFPFSQTHYFAHFIAARELETLQQHAQWAEILSKGAFVVFMRYSCTIHETRNEN